MWKAFLPNKYYSKYDKIHFDDFKDKKVIIFDLDNTLVAHDIKKPTKEILSFIHEVKEAGYIVVIASNNKKNRVSLFCQELDIDYYYFSLKPFPFVFKKIKNKYKCNKKEMILIGDQLMTDILGAKLYGIDCLLVNQIAPKDITYTKVNRVFEKYIFKKIEKYGIKKGNYHD